MNHSNINNDSKAFIFTLIAVIVITLFPYLYYQEDICMRFGDNMDSNIVWAKMLLDNNACWVAPTTIIEQVMNGVPRSSLSSTYDLSLLIFWIFGIFWGYALNKVVMAALAFVGMYLLLKKHFVRDTVQVLVPTLTAFLYALLPFWSFTGSVALLPLALWAFLNLRAKDTRLINWLALLVYGFYSSLVLTGFFILLLMTILFLYDIIRKKKIDYALLGGLAFLSIVYIISHWPIFYTHLFTSGYVSHRTEFYDAVASPNVFWDFLLVFRHSDEFGASHALSLQNPFILLTVGCTFILMLIKKSINKKFILLLSLIVIFSFIPGFLKVHGIYEAGLFVFQNFLPIDISRVFWMTPLLWYIVFGISLAFIQKNIPFGKYIVIALFVCQLTVTYRYSEVIRYQDSQSTYKTFYSEEQFSQIKEAIKDEPKNYRVISVGMHPVIAQFNGLYTLDGYLPDYALEYKHQFGEVIADELKKDSWMSTYFYNWGSRCYAYTYDTFKSLRTSSFFDQVTYPINISYNFEKLKQLAKGKDVYIISTAEMNNTELDLVDTFIQDKWIWKIRLYKVK